MDNEYVVIWILIKNAENVEKERDWARQQRLVGSSETNKLQIKMSRDRMNDLRTVFK
jgi:hypothetical protein